MENEQKGISIIEESSKSELLSIHENMSELISRADDIVVEINDDTSYKEATELKKVIKATHVAIEKKRKELKAPIIAVGKRLDEFAKSIYLPLKDAEQLVKNKMIPYEQEKERIKEQERIEKERKEQESKLIEQKLFELNSTLAKINSCKTKKDITEIENYLDNLNLNDFLDRSDEAGFIISNLKMTCSMVKNNLPDETESVVLNGFGEHEIINDPIVDSKNNNVEKEILTTKNEVNEVEKKIKEVSSELNNTSKGINEEMLEFDFEKIGSTQEVRTINFQEINNYVVRLEIKSNENMPHIIIVKNTAKNIDAVYTLGSNK